MWELFSEAWTGGRVAGWVRWRSQRADKAVWEHGCLISSAFHTSRSLILAGATPPHRPPYRPRVGHGSFKLGFSPCWFPTLRQRRQRPAPSRTPRWSGDTASLTVCTPCDPPDSSRLPLLSGSALLSPDFRTLYSLSARATPSSVSLPTIMPVGPRQSVRYPPPLLRTLSLYTPALPCILPASSFPSFPLCAFDRSCGCVGLIYSVVWPVSERMEIQYTSCNIA
ncbi:hypothetical protein OF83DRAFT_407567 [Amylostereum chailletii]|nr:hypothetical protein OF83DRAFT_407567 [Amylostereum chailletii]